MEQARNRRGNHFLELDGKRLIITDWAKCVGVTPRAIYQRLENGWSLRNALTVPAVPSKGKRVDFS